MATSEGSIAAAVEACRRELLGSSPSPGLDARVLAGFALGMDASALIAYGDNVIDERLLKRLAALTARRKAGEPIAYLIGRKEFRRLRLFVDRRVLVPRPETEELVELVLHDRRRLGGEFLDLGTGSGAIACAIADALPDARVLATDSSPDALQVAAKNVDECALADAVELAQGDLFDAVPEGRAFDVIVANLPYVGTANDDMLEKNVRDHEPAEALYGGEDGLDAYRRMLPGARTRLKAGGALYMECGPANARALASIAAKSFPDADVEIVRDLAGLERIVVVRTGEDGA
jgi:release factor glutamine methyltransferase